MNRNLVFILVPLALGAAGGEAFADPRPVDLATVLTLTEENHPDLKASVHERRAAVFGRKEALARMGPTLTVEGNFNVWDSAVDLSLGGDSFGKGFDPTLLPPPATPYEGAFLEFAGGLASAFGEPVTVRDRVTAGLSVTVVQPLTPLLAMYDGYKAAALMVTINDLAAEQKRRDALLAATKAYYGALQVAGFAEVAAEAVELLTALVKRARTFHEAGVLEKTALLEAEAALANAEVALSSAETGVRIARMGLALAVGLPPSEELTPITDGSRTIAPLPGYDIAEAERRSLETRPELKLLEAQLAALNYGVKASTKALIPTVALVARYSHTEGSGLAAKDEVFGGAMLSWEALDWGAKLHARAAAKARADAADAAMEKVRSGLAFQVRAAYLRLTAAASALTSAERAVTAAEENVRIATVRFDASAGTSTEVLDAETRRSRSVNEQTQAYYSYLIALAELRAAIGEPILGSATTGSAKP